MAKLDAAQFWLRYKEITSKDFPTILLTGIKQSTLSTWRRRKLFPRADEAYMIACAINSNLEYLISGQNKPYIYSSETVSEIAALANDLSPDGQILLKNIAINLTSTFNKLTWHGAQ